MAEYIKKSDALGVLEHCAMWNRSINAAYDEMQAIPAADVALVVHGEWIKRCITSVDSPDVSECSICKYPVSTMWGRTNYCPNCGADMRGENNA